MKPFVLFICFCASLFLISRKERVILKSKPGISYDKCQFKGKTLYGKIRLVEYASQADISVKIVNSFPDLKIKFVENHADECGEWNVVETGEDLKVYITENFADLKVKPVNSFPGLAN